jgi:eukaryotic-like serine/threonine-protein kinase
VNEQSLFIEALEKEDPAERAAFLDQRCAGDPPLRQRIERLLHQHGTAGRFLDSPAEKVVATIDEPAGERAGTVIGPYKLLEQIGEGGFGIVFMAEQLQPIRRKVALKVLKPGMDTRQVIGRFEAERQALALMDHANIAKVLDAGQTADGRPYFVMDLVRGVPITTYCDQARLTPRERLELFADVCQAVQHAHQKGIIHRDIKPSNVLVTLQDGSPLVKVIDFGIAKALGQQLSDRTVFTGFAQMIGTPLYMSPEQAALSNVDVDTRTDIYSLGVLLYELLTGTTPFDDTRLLAADYDELRRIIREEDPPKPSTRLSTLGRAAPTVAAQRRSDPKRLSQLFQGELDWIVMKALEKDRNRRYETAKGFAMDVQRYLSDEPVLACPPSAGYRFRKFARRNKTALTTAALVALALVAGIGVATWQAKRATRAESAVREERDKTWAHAQIQAIAAHNRAQRFQQAFDLLQKVEAILPEDPRLPELRTECSWLITISTTPPGATISRKHPDGDEESWERLGVTPIENRRLARGVYHWRFEKPDYVTAERLTADHPPGRPREGFPLLVELDKEGEAPSDMVRVSPSAPGWFWGMSKNRGISIPPFWLDRFEVTNRRFKPFVDQGAYQRRELWEHPFEKDGRQLSWDEAMALFRDSTGRPGPATWAGGSYPVGEDDYPVSGVSWYEAAAFAKFAGKRLPTIYDWNGASGRLFHAAEIISRSNFAGAGPARVGRYPGLSHCGAYDMAGNVKEWCWNRAGDGKHYVLGGAWDEQKYVFALHDSRPGLDRDTKTGFRCVKYLPGRQPPKEAFEESKPRVRDFQADKLLTVDQFQLVKGHYEYDRAKPLNAVRQRQGETAYWVHERVEVDAAYGKESLIVHLFLPKDAAPPYHPVTYWPGATAFFQPTISPPTAENVAFLVRSGRALVWPVYKGTYERRVQPPLDAEWKWEHVVQQANDLRRSIDYLEARPEEFDLGALGYYGYSWGAAHAVRALAVEDRIKAAVLVDGGLLPPGSFEDSERDPFQRPERDPIHYLPQITIPVLMLNGEYDSNFPLRESQEPMYRLLGADPARKRHLLSDIGHVSTLSDARMRETVTWFDQYLGPVRWKDGAATGPR